MIISEIKGSRLNFVVLFIKLLFARFLNYTISIHSCTFIFMLQLCLLNCHFVRFLILLFPSVLVVSYLNCILLSVFVSITGVFVVMFVFANSD